MRGGFAAVAVVLILAGCAPRGLPDPESAGAEIYRVRCSPCHALYAPRSLTRAMWEMQVERMQREMVRRAVVPLTNQERHLILTYLRAHASDAPAVPAVSGDRPSPATSADGRTP